MHLNGLGAQLNHSLFTSRLDRLRHHGANGAISDIKHGIERESLRVDMTGQLSQTPHPTALGSALKHNFITTDYSESLLELITEPQREISGVLERLSDIHKFTHGKLPNELLWPSSMPCSIDRDDDINIAQYGTSNLGRMKTLYRQGLKHRYGSMMQVIAGIHYNFSLPKSFWKVVLDDESVTQSVISQKYFDLIRNYQRMNWMIPYLFGASPAVDQAFLQDKPTHFDFKRVGQHTLYLPYATSLRMSDLGYTNDAQSSLRICYNTLDDYVSTVRAAIKTPAPEYQVFDACEGERRRQLNANVLQIENELYSSIRPKQPTQLLEKPTDALESRGVEYVEVRALDLQPDSEIGITSEQCHFLDAFLVYCALEESPAYEPQEYNEVENNMKAVVEAGRDPSLLLVQLGKQRKLSEWATEILQNVDAVAAVMDELSGGNAYRKATELQQAKVNNVELTPSARIVKQLVDQQQDLSAMSLAQAIEQKRIHAGNPFVHYSEAIFEQENLDSHAKQRAQEDADTVTFERFLTDYFDTE